MADGIRTRDRRHHKPELYQLSYCHRAISKSSGPSEGTPRGADSDVPGDGMRLVGLFEGRDRVVGQVEVHRRHRVVEVLRSGHADDR